MEEEFKGCGFRLTGKEDLGTLEVCRFPDRQSVSVCITHGSVVKPLAYFRDDECAKEFMDWLHNSFVALGALKAGG